MRLSLCMIVRDEEASLGACLESARNVVDEICIVDTGSIDGTVALATQFGAKVETFEWADDFSAARNASLAMATGDWILVLDADERVATEDAREKLLAFASTESDRAGRVLILDADESGADTGRCPTTRFYPRRLDPSYEGVIHEQVTLGGEPAAVADTGVEVRHEGYSKEAVTRKDKLARNARILRSAIERSPADAYFHYQLGRTCSVAEDHEGALEAYANALQYVEPGTSYLAHLFESTSYALRALGQSEEALDLMTQVSPAFPYRADTCFLEALLSMDTGHFAAAEAGFRRCLELGDTEPSGGPFSLVAQTVGPAYNLGVLYEVLGHPEAAQVAYNQALGFDGRHEASLAGLKRIRD